MDENKIKIELLKEILADYWEWNSSAQNEDKYVNGVLCAIGSIVYSDSTKNKTEV